MILTGTVVSGRREAAGFLALPWVAEQLDATFGLTPFPGTLNLHLTTEESRARWDGLQALRGGQRLDPPEGSGFCAATGYPVRVNGQVSGVVLRPAVKGYPPDVAEVVAADSLRRRFGLMDGDTCRLLLQEDAGPRFACVLFDLEGTLVDFQWRLAEAEQELRAAVAELGFDRAPFAADNYAAIRRRALESAPSADARLAIDRRLGPIYDRYDQDALSRWALRDGARELLQDLNGCAIRTGLVSNIGTRAVTGALDRFGLRNVFGTIVSRNDVTRMKPDGEGLQTAMAALGVTAAQTLMVGDSLSDLGAARAAGVAVAILAGGESAPAAITAAAPDYRLERLTEVASLV